MRLALSHTVFYSFLIGSIFLLGSKTFAEQHKSPKAKMMFYIVVGIILISIGILLAVNFNTILTCLME